MEPTFPVREHVGEVERLDAGDVLADQVPEVTLSGHEADDRDGTVGLPGLDQLHQLVALGLDEADVRRVGGEPEDQLVEEEDQPVVAERFGVVADDAQALVEIDVGFILGLGDAPIGREDLLDQDSDQETTLGRRRLFLVALLDIHPEPGTFGDGGIESLGRPAGELAPTRLRRSLLAGPGPIQILEELLVTQSIPVLFGILEDLLGQVDARQRGAGVMLHDVIDVAAQDGRFHVPGADHVIRHQQELLALDPGVPGADLRQVVPGPHGGVVLQHQEQDRHEVRLARPEAAVQVARLAVPGIDGRPDEPQGVVETRQQLRRDDVLVERLLGFV